MRPIERHAQHGRPVLQFSGGKDSLACLELLRPWWPILTVAWCNTGDAFPETEALTRSVASKVGRFIEVRSDVTAWQAENGWPCDILPVGNTPLSGRCDERPRLCLATSCCAANVWAPMQRAMHEIKATLVVRGQKACDGRKGPLLSGAVVDGVEYWYPLEDWTDEQVFAYLREHAVEIPEHYELAKTSLDCRHCTAYLDEALGKLRWMRDRHPGVHTEVGRRVAIIADAARSELAAVDAAMKEVA